MPLQRSSFLQMTQREYHSAVDAEYWMKLEIVFQYAQLMALIQGIWGLALYSWRVLIAFILSGDRQELLQFEVFQTVSLSCHLAKQFVDCWSLDYKALMPNIHLSFQILTDV